MINVFQPSLGDEELAAVAEVFESSWVGKGPRVRAFEEAFAHHIEAGADQVVSTNSCTEATFLAMELLDVGPGDEVILPSISFVGAANAVAAHGARPVFCDVDERLLNPSVAHIEARLTPSTKGVLLLHYGGRPGYVEDIAQLCRDRGIWLVEDAANAQASRAGGRACGTIGDLGVWSFDWGKMVVAVDGGMLFARDPELISSARKRTYFGMEQASGYSQAFKSHTRWWEFEVSSFARRSVMNDVQAAIGLVQLGKIEDAVARRRAVADSYDTLLETTPGVLLPPKLPPEHDSSYYFYWVQLDPAIRDAVAKDLFDKGIYTTFRYPALHQVRAYGADAHLPGAESAAASTLCLPIHQALSDDDIDFVASSLTTAIKDRSRNDLPAQGRRTAAKGTKHAIWS